MTRQIRMPGPCPTVYSNPVGERSAMFERFFGEGKPVPFTNANQDRVMVERVDSRLVYFRVADGELKCLARAVFAKRYRREGAL